MEEQHTADDQSHYEISLTAGQAFVAFVLLLLSLAASFAFGLMLGKGQADERLVVRKENPVVVEAGVTPAKSSGEIVELGVDADDFSDGDSPAKPATVIAEDSSSDAAEPAEAAPVMTEEFADALTQQKAADQQKAAEATAASKPADVQVAEKEKPKEAPAKQPAAMAAPTSTAPQVAATAKPSTERVPHVAQLLSTADQKTAEAMAVKLINRGFKTAYVERGANGSVYRVRVRFQSEWEARTAEPKLREFSKEVWITAG